MAEPVSAFFWARDALVEQYGSRQYLYGRWDCLFGCWSIDRADLKSFYPPWKLVDAAGRLCWGHPRNQDMGNGLEHPVSAIAGPTADFLEQYADLIPLAIRRVAGAFEAWQWVILSMIWDMPAFADFLAAELDGIGPSFVAASLVMNGADKLASEERSDLCRRIMSAKRTDLIPGIPPDCSAKAVASALGKLPLGSLSAGTWRGLLEIVSDSSKAKIAGHCRVLTPGMIRLLYRLPAWMCTGLPARLLPELGDHDHDIRQLGALAVQVDHDATGSRGSVVRSLAQAKDRAHLLDLVQAWTVRIRETTGFPETPLLSAGPLQPLSSAEMLRSEGQRMRNCIASYLPRVMEGRAYFYRWDAEEPACVMLARTRHGAWRLHECLGEGNRQLTEATKAQVSAAVRAALEPLRATTEPVRAAPEPKPVRVAPKRVRVARKARIEDPRQGVFPF
ncbi:MAG TPA: hypothetical protein VKI44_31590 [Acetobacteraceae bacterium]|nr:hypothetical protein [Acetobacteraceae bacterium]